MAYYVPSWDVLSLCREPWGFLWAELPRLDLFVACLDPSWRL
jgi:hypothetical protein